MLFIENQLGRQAGGGVEMETCRLDLLPGYGDSQSVGK